MSDVPDTTFDDCKYRKTSEVVEALGLIPLDEFEQTHANDIRATGRTTKMLCYAVMYSQLKPVIISAYNHRYSKDLQLQAKRMAEKIGLDPERILYNKQIVQFGEQRNPDVFYMFDHSWYWV